MKSNFKYLIKNIGLLAVSQFGTKILTFFLVPLYTNVLTTSEYGTYDLFNTTVGLLMPVVTVNIADAILVFALDKEKDKADVFSIGLKYVLWGMIFCFIFSDFNKITDIIKPLTEYWYYLPLLLFCTAMVTNLTCFARGTDKVKETAISGVLCSAVMICLNIFFLLYVKIGLQGYFLASILGMTAQIIYLWIKVKCCKYIKFNPDKEIDVSMRKYSIPMVANTLGWWINNSSDRYIVILFCGVAANGIYSVGYKIPQIINIFQSIFNSAWTMSAVKNFDPEDKSGFFSKIYSLYNCGMVMVCSCIIIFTRILAYFLYAGEFFLAWKYVPFLTIAIVFGALSGYLGGVFSAVRDSKIFAKSTVIGAVINIILNVILVYFIGALGAAIATFVSYFIVWILRYKQARKYIVLKIWIKRDAISYFILLFQTIMLFHLNDGILLYSLEVISLIILFLLYKIEIFDIFRKVLRRIK